MAIIERTEHPGWLSNAYLVADRVGGHGVFVDGNGVMAPLIEAAARLRVQITHVLVTHSHPDHVDGALELAQKFEVPLAADPQAAVVGATMPIVDGDVLQCGDMTIRALATPGHAIGHLAFLFDDTDVLTADVLFKGTVGGTRGGGPTGFADLKHSIMDVLLPLGRELRVHPGHKEPTTIGAEQDSNPFIRVWSGADPEGTEPCTAGGRPATLIVWGPDYDGGHKAWVRRPDGADEIVGGSQVVRG